MSYCSSQPSSQPGRCQLGSPIKVSHVHESGTLQWSWPASEPFLSPCVITPPSLCTTSFHFFIAFHTNPHVLTQTHHLPPFPRYQREVKPRIQQPTTYVWPCMFNKLCPQVHHVSPRVLHQIHLTAQACKCHTHHDGSGVEGFVQIPYMFDRTSLTHDSMFDREQLSGTLKHCHAPRWTSCWGWSRSRPCTRTAPRPGTPTATRSCRHHTRGPSRWAAAPVIYMIHVRYHWYQ